MAIPDLQQYPQKLYLIKYELDINVLIYSNCPFSFAPAFFFFNIKGTVGVISSEPPCKDGNVRFTTVPLKALSDQVCIINQCL